MKDLFPGYYRPTDEEFNQKWQECIFVFDANMLLNIYRYTSDTQELFISILERLKDRIWLPNQAALEFYRRRLDVITGQLKDYDDISIQLDDSYKKLCEQLARYKRHASIDFERFTGLIKEGIEKAKDSLKEDKKNHPDISSEDPLRDKITDLFNDKVGKEFNDKRLAEIYQEAELRFKLLKPPGFEDLKDKEFPNKYGDVVLWFQLIEFAKTAKKPIIFITDDRKKDWWQKEKGETISPRPELTFEIYNKAKVWFYMYHSDQFLKFASEFLKFNNQEKAIEEVSEIIKQDGLLEPKRRLLNKSVVSDFAFAAFNFCKEDIRDFINNEFDSLDFTLVNEDGDFEESDFENIEVERVKVLDNYLVDYGNSYAIFKTDLKAKYNVDITYDYENEDGTKQENFDGTTEISAEIRISYDIRKGIDSSLIYKVNIDPQEIEISIEDF